MPHEPQFQRKDTSVGDDGELAGAIFCTDCGAVNEPDATECGSCNAVLAEQGNHLSARLRRISRRGGTAQFKPDQGIDLIGTWSEIKGNPAKEVSGTAAQISTFGLRVLDIDNERTLSERRNNVPVQLERIRQRISNPSIYETADPIGVRQIESFSSMIPIGVYYGIVAILSLVVLLVSLLWFYENPFVAISILSFGVIDVSIVLFLLKLLSNTTQS